MEAAFALYNVNVANNSRRELLDVINTAFKANGVDVEVSLKPLRYKIDVNDDSDTRIDDNQDPKGETQTEEEVTEREKNT